MHKLRIKLSIVYIFINIGILNAQVIENGGFDNTNTSMSMYLSPNAACPVFDKGYIYNWYRTHGTPEIVPPYHPSSMYPTTAIRLHNNNQISSYPNIGEGIVGSYPFKKGVAYTIEIGIYNATGLGNCYLDNYQIKVFATNNLKEGPNEYMYLAPNQFFCVAPVPTVNQDGSTFQKEPITTSGPHNVNQSVTITASYIPSNDFSQIWVYNDQSGCLTRVDINYVKVYSCMDGTVHYQTTIPNGLTAKSNIYIDEDISTTKNDINNNTTLIGTNINFGSSIYSTWEGTFAQSTLIKTTSEKFFLALAVTGCEQETQEEPYNPIIGEQRTNTESNGLSVQEKTVVPINNILDGQPNKNSSLYSSLNKSEIQAKRLSLNSTSRNKLTIHPNPTTGQLNITMPVQGDYEVKITNMLGVVVYSGKLKDEQQKQVQLDASLPSGNYTVQITGKEVNHIEKITLTR